MALGVAVVVAIDLANGSAQRAFALSTETITGRATHQIVGGPNGLDEALYRSVRLDLGVRQSAPLVEGYAAAPRSPRPDAAHLGIDPLAEAPFRSFTCRRGGSSGALGIAGRPVHQARRGAAVGRYGARLWAEARRSAAHPDRRAQSSAPR